MNILLTTAQTLVSINCQQQLFTTSKIESLTVTRKTHLWRNVFQFHSVKYWQIQLAYHLLATEMKSLKMIIIYRGLFHLVP